MVRQVAVRSLLAALAAGSLAACSLASEPLVAAIMGAGTSTALTHSINGTTYRTFTAPLDEVRQATLDAFNRMGIRLEYMETLEEGELVVGSAARRTIYVDLEPISGKSTRMRVVTKNGGVLYDGATAAEIVLQAERALAAPEAKFASQGASRR